MVLVFEYSLPLRWELCYYLPRAIDALNSQGKAQTPLLSIMNAEILSYKIASPHCSSFVADGFERFAAAGPKVAQRDYLRSNLLLSR